MKEIFPARNGILPRLVLAMSIATMGAAISVVPVPAAEQLRRELQGAVDFCESDEQVICGFVEDHKGDRVFEATRVDGLKVGNGWYAGIGWFLVNNDIGGCGKVKNGGHIATALDRNRTILKNGKVVFHESGSDQAKMCSMSKNKFRKAISDYNSGEIITEKEVFAEQKKEEVSKEVVEVAERDQLQEIREEMWKEIVEKMESNEGLLWLVSAGVGLGVLAGIMSKRSRGHQG